MASSFQSKIIKAFKKAGYYVIKHQRTNTNGLPDLQNIKDGHSVFIESKELDDRLSELQKHRIDELLSNGCDAFCLQDGKGIIYGDKPSSIKALRIVEELTPNKNC